MKKLFQTSCLTSLLAATLLSMTGCASDEAATNGVSIADSAKYKFHMFALPPSRTVVGGQAQAKRKPHTRSLGVTEVSPWTASLTRNNTIDTQSDWKDMNYRYMSVKVVDPTNVKTIYGNFYIGSDSVITSNMGPYFFTDPTSSGSTVTAWYPSTGSADLNGATFSVKKNQSTFGMVERSDLMYGFTTGAVTANNYPIMQFHHQTSKIVVKLTIDTAVTDGGHVYAAQSVAPQSVKLSGGFTEGTFTTTSPYYYAMGLTPNTSSQDTIECWLDSVFTNTATGKKTYTYIALIVPSNSSSNKQTLFIHVDINGAQYKGQVEPFQYNGGYEYTVNAPMGELDMVYTWGGNTIEKGDYLFQSSSGRVFCVDKTQCTEAYNRGLTAIAVVVGTTTTGYEKQKSWTHGWAMATKNAHTAAEWRKVGQQVVDYKAGNAWGLQQYTNSTTTDMLGYQQTKYIVDSACLGNQSTLLNLFPAFYYAVNFNPTLVEIDTVATSGWYLPSQGQWREYLVACGNNSGNGTSGNSGAYYYYYWQGAWNSTKSALHSYYTGFLNASDYDEFGNTSALYSTYQIYWTSTEASAGNGVNVGFNTNGNVYYFVAEDAKTRQYYVRPAISF